jgi:GH43 family beta-xylosidase
MTKRARFAAQVPRCARNDVSVFTMSKPFPSSYRSLEPLEPRRLLAGNGLRGEYFDDANLTALKFTRTDPQINFDFAKSSPLPRYVSADTFSVRWTGMIAARSTGTHTFHLAADDGVRLWINDQLVIDRWQDRPRHPGDANGDHTVSLGDFAVVAANFNQSPRNYDQGDFDGDGAVTIGDFSLLAANFNTTQPIPEYTGQINLQANQSVNLKLEYYDRTADASVQLRWTEPGASESSLVPRDRLYDTISPATMISNPIAAEGADPWVIQWEGEYLYVRSDGGRIFVHRSPTLQGIANAPGAMVYNPPPGTTYSQNLWAPELHRLDGKWYIYFAADNGPNENHRMYVVEGTTQNPQSAYAFKGKIAATTDRWAIDGTVAEIGGQRYFIWSGWEGFTDGRQDLYIATMSSPWTISGNRVRIATPQFAWEQHGLPINEGPQILTRNGKLHVIYSASGYWTNEYALGQLTFQGGNPLSAAAWSKKNTPVFAQGNNVVGVGHASFVKSPDGLQDWIVYHAHNTPGTFTGIRDVRTQPFTWNPDDTPNFGAPRPTGMLIEEPSGTPHLV